MVACTPHSGLGTVAIERPAYVQVVDLATCRTTREKTPQKTGPTIVVRRHGDRGTQSIVFRGRVVLTVRESYKGFPAGSPGPLAIFGTTPGGRWILFGVDPMGSESLVADGWKIEAVSVRTHAVRTVVVGLAYDDYRTWCGSRLVAVAGGDRISVHNKWLIETGPPTWQARVIVKRPSRAFGSLACSADGRSIVVQSAPSSGPNDNARANWSLWRVGLNGSMRPLTTPPPGTSDESPRVVGSTTYFVRRGSLYALRDGVLTGPLLRLGAPAGGYYGHIAWPYSVRR